MSTAQGSIESAVVELSEEALNAFADDIATMFDVDVECEQTDVGLRTPADIQKRYEKVSTFHSVESKGVLQGTFSVGFDCDGLFTLGGVIVMLPPNRIKESAQGGTVSDAEVMADAVGEVGNLLIGAWDRVFREELEGHKHFRKENTFIGNPWDETESVFGLSPAEEFHYIEYKMTVGEFTPFTCGVIFPLATLAGGKNESEPDEAPITEATAEAEPQPDPEPSSPAAEEPVQTPEPDEAPITEATAEAEPEPDPEPSPPAAEETVQTPEPDAAPIADATAEAELEPDPEPSPPAAEEPVQAPEPVTEPAAVESPAEQATQATDPEPTVAPVVPEAASDPAAEPPAPQVQSEADIQPEEVDEKTVAPKDIPRPQSARTPARVIASNEGLADILSLPVREIMDTRVVWGRPSDSVKDLLSKMQQHDVGYAMIGEEGVLDGIVSKSNILGAISPYLRPVFAKWHTPADDATLNIKIQWVMSRPVRTVGPDAALSIAIQSMQQFGGRCLPVVDDRGEVLGILTVFDIFRVFSQNDQFGTSGRTPQAPCLMI